MSTPSRNERVASYAKPRRERERIGTARSYSTSSTSGDDDTADGYAHEMKMRATWDALASDPDAYVGDPKRGRMELQGLFERLGADPSGGTCVEVGCGSGRMTGGPRRAIRPGARARRLPGDARTGTRGRSRRARRFPRRVRRAARRRGRRERGRPRLLPRPAAPSVARAPSSRYLAEFARVLLLTERPSFSCRSSKTGSAARLARAARSALVPLTSLGPTRRREFRGYRLTRRELDARPRASRAARRGDRRRSRRAVPLQP